MLLRCFADAFWQAISILVPNIRCHLLASVESWNCNERRKTVTQRQSGSKASSRMTFNTRALAKHGASFDVVWHILTSTSIASGQVSPWCLRPAAPEQNQPGRQEQSLVQETKSLWDSTWQKHIKACKKTSEWKDIHKEQSINTHTHTCIYTHTHTDIHI